MNNFALDGPFERPIISHKLRLKGDEWDGEVQYSKTRLKDRASLLWAIGMGKSMDLPHMIFMSLCAAYNSSDTRGSVPFTGFLTELFKRHGIHIPVDLIKTEPKKPIDRYSLTQSKRQRKKRRLKAIASEEPSIGMAELKEAITSLRMEFDTCMTALEE
ncbi:hypothetical protein Acr_00g0011210 [Actinidia rufa]|uniref:Uncharacterized protein n=1 Tax=Actinidia rufa TaxID=165716 RepID=A0A7J0D9D7_9ERIC|nr:hypothetical protein Acr_00g0011210 [Actinidia rufa]